MEMVSIIVPVFNAEKYIDQCLSALLELNYPKHAYEIIVVDNGSTDRTLEIIREYPVKLFALPKVTVSRLRNFGVSQAQGHVLAFTDADCIAPSSWLKKSVQLLQKEGVGAAGCWYALPQDPTFLEKVWNAHMSLRRLQMGDIDWVPSGNLIMYRQVFDKIGGFDETLTTSEDVDICQRIHRADLSIFTHPDLAVVHLGESKDLKHFLLKEKWRGEGVIQNLIREFPHVRLNKAIAFTGITFLALIGILVSLLTNNRDLLGSFTLLFISIPSYLSIKACLISKQWQYSIPLIFLFALYAMARILSAFNARVWKPVSTLSISRRYSEVVSK